MEGETEGTRSIIDELDSSNTAGDILEGESGVTGDIIDALLSSDIQGDQ